MGNKLSSFTALGPAVYAGPVFRNFPFSFIRLFKGRKIWSLVFGGKCLSVQPDFLQRRTSNGLS